MSTSALRLLASALRGAAIGLVVCGIFALTARYADQTVTESLVALAFAGAAMVPPNGRRRPTPVPSEPGPRQ